MFVQRRVTQLERAFHDDGDRVPPGACTDASAWTRRFREHDPANAALLDAIARWDVKMHPWCTLSIEYGLAADNAFARLLIALVNAVRDGSHLDTACMHQGPDLFRRLVTAAHDYQATTSDVLYDNTRSIHALAERGERPGTAPSWLLLASMCESYFADPGSAESVEFRENVNRAWTARP